LNHDRRRDHSSHRAAGRSEPAIQRDRIGPHRPLAIGIHRSLRGLTPSRQIDTIMRVYCGRAAYLRSLTAGADRVDLAGTPVGIITDARRRTPRPSSQPWRRRRRPRRRTWKIDAANSNSGRPAKTAAQAKSPPTNIFSGAVAPLRASACRSRCLYRAHSSCIRCMSGSGVKGGAGCSRATEPWFLSLCFTFRIYRWISVCAPTTMPLGTSVKADDRASHRRIAGWPEP
jgi:sRNA-binding protein